MEPYTMDDVRRDIALMRAEQELFTAAILTVVSAVSSAANQSDITTNASWAVTRAKELAAQKVAYGL